MAATRWVDPAFAAYPLAEQYTGWVYGDPQSNPAYWDQPDKWPDSGYVTFQDREIQVTPLPQGGTPTRTITLDLDLTGGKNCVIFARYASAVLDTGSGFAPPAPNQQLPTQLWSYIMYSQRLVEGYMETQETALSNVFGTGWAPHTFPAPMLWNDKLKRTIAMRNTLDSSVQPKPLVTLGWKVAYLNTGA